MKGKLKMGEIGWKIENGESKERKEDKRILKIDEEGRENNELNRKIERERWKIVKGIEDRIDKRGKIRCEIEGKVGEIGREVERKIVKERKNGKGILEGREEGRENNEIKRKGED